MSEISSRKTLSLDGWIIRPASHKMTAAYHPKRRMFRLRNYIHGSIFEDLPESVIDDLVDLRKTEQEQESE